jgi:hypothetical protein
VRYPWPASTSASVTTPSASRVSPGIEAPWCHGSSEVRIDAWDASVIGAWAMQVAARSPSAASASMWGVVGSG